MQASTEHTDSSNCEWCPQDKEGVPSTRRPRRGRHGPLATVIQAPRSGAGGGFRGFSLLRK